jgi:hypothetical protein
MKIKAQKSPEYIDIVLDNYQMRDIAIEYVIKRHGLPLRCWIKDNKIMKFDDRFDEDKVFDENPTPELIKAVEMLNFLKNGG